MADLPDAVYEAAAEALIATRDVIRAETDWCLECAGEEVAALRAAKIAIDAVAPILIAEGRRQAARQIIARDEAEGDWDINMAYWAAVRIAEGTDA